MTDTPIDEFHGHGGSYVVGDDGKRRLLERTQAEASAPAADPAPAGAAAQAQSAKTKAKADAATPAAAPTQE